MESYSNINEAFVFYSNWKDASGDKGGFASHECSSVHKRAVEVVKLFLEQPLHDIGKHNSNIIRCVAAFNTFTLMFRSVWKVN